MNFTIFAAKQGSKLQNYFSAKWTLSVWASWLGKKIHFHVPSEPFGGNLPIWLWFCAVSWVWAGTESSAAQIGAINKQRARFFPFFPLNSSHPYLFSAANVIFHLFPGHWKGQSFTQTSTGVVAWLLQVPSGILNNYFRLWFPIFKMGIKSLFLCLFMQQIIYLATMFCKSSSWWIATNSKNKNHVLPWTDDRGISEYPDLVSLRDKGTAHNSWGPWVYFHGSELWSLLKRRVFWRTR